MPPLTLVYPDPEAVAHAAAERIAVLARRAVAQRGQFTLALAGGRTPQPLYERLAGVSHRHWIPWDAVHVFLGDERHVPADHPESNWRTAQETLLGHVPIPAEHLHRVPTERDPEDAAHAYENTLRGVVGDDGLDLVLLGLGEDGHTASLFPGTAAVTVERRGVVANLVPQREGWRITLTAAEINAADTVMFLATGERKADVAARVLGTGADLPATGIRPASGELVWWLDAAAAAELDAAAGEVDTETLKQQAAEAAVLGVTDDQALGLGTGSTARYMIEALGRRLAQGRLSGIIGVPTSESTQRLARAAGVPLTTLNAQQHLDQTIDGADEVTSALELTKGMGGALVREKMVAAASDRMAVVIDAGKQVPVLGTRSPLPVAVVPFGWQTHLDPLRSLGADPSLRRDDDGQPLVTDDGLYLIDCQFADGLPNPYALRRFLSSRPGIVDSGLFIDMADVIYIGRPGGVWVKER